jgi:nucleotide-binding universal stress UspA family protein
MADRPVIVLADDGGDASSSARVAAIDLARRAGARLVIVYAVEHPDESGARARRDLHEIMTEGCDGIDARVHISQGDAVDVLLRTIRTHHADLVVTGHHHRGRLGHWLFGSVAEGLVESGRTPVLVVPLESTWPPQQFIVGEDGSDGARAAGDVAAQLALWLGADVRLVEMLAHDSLGEGLLDEERVVAAGRYLRTRALEVAGKTHRRTRIEVHLAEPVDMLERLASHTRRPSCIAVGRPHRSAGSPLPRGVGDTLLRHGESCLLIHPGVPEAAGAAR